MKNRNGDEIGTLSLTGPLGGTTTFDLAADVDIFAISPLLLWVSPWEILGARYAAAIAPSFADGNLNASLSVARSGRLFQGGFSRDLESDTGLGVGDLYVHAVTLGWGCLVRSLAGQDRSSSGDTEFSA